MQVKNSAAAMTREAVLLSINARTDAQVRHSRIPAYLYRAERAAEPPRKSMRRKSI